MQSVNLASNSIKKNSKSRSKIENVRKMRKNARLKKKKRWWRGKCNSSNKSWWRERSGSFKKKGEGHRRKRKREMLEEIYLNRAVKTSELNTVKLKRNRSRGKRSHRNGSSLQHLKQRIYNLHSLAISNQTITIASLLISITSPRHIKTNSLLNSKSPDPQ